jgi:hypothetical protein
VQISPRSGALKQGVYHTNRYNVSDAHVSIQGALALDADEPAADDGADDGADPLLPLATNSVVIAGWESQARATCRARKYLPARRAGANTAHIRTSD